MKQKAQKPTFSEKKTRRRLSAAGTMLLSKFKRLHLLPTKKERQLLVKDITANKDDDWYTYKHLWNCLDKRRSAAKLVQRTTKDQRHICPSLSIDQSSDPEATSTVPIVMDNLEPSMATHIMPVSTGSACNNFGLPSTHPSSEPDTFLYSAGEPSMPVPLSDGPPMSEFAWLEFELGWLPGIGLADEGAFAAGACPQAAYWRHNVTAAYDCPGEL
ncbi:hypothetical protein OBBRIDRAFT_795149 [Obba rivulosa]|uniref:Uncharacterized protein n=1 Tax=Obba rivulosa TaxID=1052685 RepID=A0A8E2DIR5_9APHY|nr:hypothetical protein OBBRIDRAFT_795149 [Obba rivulosa]